MLGLNQLAQGTRGQGPPTTINPQMVLTYTYLLYTIIHLFYIVYCQLYFIGDEEPADYVYDGLLQ